MAFTSLAVGTLPSGFGVGDFARGIIEDDILMSFVLGICSFRLFSSHSSLFSSPSAPTMPIVIHTALLRSTSTSLGGIVLAFLITASSDSNPSQSKLIVFLQGLEQNNMVLVAAPIFMYVIPAVGLVVRLLKVGRTD